MEFSYLRYADRVVSIEGRRRSCKHLYTRYIQADESRESDVELYCIP